MDITAKALELGMMIRDSKEMQDYQKAEIEIQSDPKALTLLNDYKLLQIELVNATREEREKEIIDGITARIDEKENELSQYETTSQFFIAKDNFDKMMKSINDIIIHTISGDQGGCSEEGCSSCSGCK